MRFWKTIHSFFLFLILLGSSLANGEHLDDDLIYLFMSSGDLLKAEDIARFKAWHSKLKLGETLTVEASNEEHDAQSLALYTVPVFTSDSENSPELICYKDLVKFQQQLALASVIYSETRNLTYPMDLSSVTAASEWKRWNAVVRLLKFYRGIASQTNFLEPGKMLATYRWRLLAEQFVPNSLEWTNFQILGFEVKRVFYPGNNWQFSNLGSYTALRAFSSPLSREDGAFVFTVEPSHEEVCRRKTPLRIELEVSFRYDYRDANQRIKTLRDSKRVALSSMNIFDFSFAGEFGTFLLSSVTESAEALRKASGKGLFEPYQHWNAIQNAVKHCHQERYAVLSQNVCKALLVIEKKYSRTWSESFLKAKIKRDINILRDHSTIQDVKERASNLLQMIVEGFPIEIILWEYDALLSDT
jgi:hypothetical protein